MNHSLSHYLHALSTANWQTLEQFVFPSPTAKEWLTEQGSLSRRIKQSCTSLSVELVSNHEHHMSQMTGEEIGMLSQEDSWLREVVLLGDNTPWVLGRTLMPVSTMKVGQFDLSQQGTIPLGVTVFSSANAKRDSLMVASVDINGSTLLARRSRLWMSESPCLVAELFLPESPVYAMEKDA